MLVVVTREPPRPGYVIVRACTDCVDFFAGGDFDAFVDAALAPGAAPREVGGDDDL